MAADNQTKVELGLAVTVAEIEIDLVATVGGPEGWSFAGAAAFGERDGKPEFTLSTLIARLQGEHGEGPWFEEAPVDVGLTGLTVSYRAEPTAFAVRSDIAVMLKAGLRFDLAFLLARAAAEGDAGSALLVALCTTSPIDLGSIVGSDTGLIGRFLGDIQLDRLGVYYASDEIELDGDLLDPRGGARLAFAKGPSFSARFGDGRAFTDLALPPPAPEPDERPAERATAPAPARPKPPKVRDERAPGEPMRFWKPLDKTIGPLKLRRIGGEWDKGKLGILLDASVSLAGLSVGLAGFAVRVEPARLPKLEFKDLEFGLDGLELAFSRGPISISGALLRTLEDGRVGYAGQAMIRAARFSIGAIGGYSSTKEGEPAFFIFGAFVGTLGGPPCFVVEGIAAGFGYNRALRLPEIEEVRDFPLVSLVLGPSEGDAGGALEHLGGANHFPPVSGQYWIAAGLKFSSFKLVEGFALVTVQFGTRFELALLGVATLRQPPAPAPRALVQVELALMVRFCPDDGVLSVMAQLTSNSFLFDTRCKLTGGFAFCVWFKPTDPRVVDRSGDFVITLGGYHPNFKVPAHYPKVPRIGFDWQMPECGVSITGGAYFALTPSFIMAGGRLQAVFRSGDFSAWFEAHADFLIGWAPLHYEAEVGVRVGAAFVLRLGGISCTLSFELGANLRIWGPPFAGEARIDLGIVAFTVPIGNRDAPRKAPPIYWPEFEKTFLPAEPLATSIVAGLVEERRSGGGYAIVNPTELCLAVESSIPATELVVGGETIAVPGGRPALGIRPLGERALRSRLAITFSGGGVVCGPTLKSAPEALWSSAPMPDPRAVPALTTNVIEEVLMGARILPPECRSYPSVESEVEIGSASHDLAARVARSWRDAPWTRPETRPAAFRAAWKPPRATTLEALGALGLAPEDGAVDQRGAFPDLWLAAPALVRMGELPAPPHGA